MIERRLPIAEEKPRLPRWLKKSLPTSEAYHQTRNLLRELKLQTVCEEARCPNQGECWSKHLATVLIMGPNCTRRCRFCAVPKGAPKPLDTAEPDRLADAIAQLGLRHIVLTSVTRDDLPDGGAGHFVACIQALRSQCPEVVVEILTPDFQFSLPESLEVFRSSPPDIWAHNIEVVERMSVTARGKGNHAATLNCLRSIKADFPSVPTKSGLMLGMGETEAEIEETLHSLRQVGVTHMTMGQYLSPSKEHLPVREFVTPEKFQEWEDRLYELGFEVVECHPFARSSYQS